MEALESQEHEEGSKSKDPYCEVIKKPEHSGRIRLYGKGVTKTKLNDGENKPSFVFPQEFLQSIQRQVEEKLQAANPGRDLVIPEFLMGLLQGFLASTRPLKLMSLVAAKLMLLLTHQIRLFSFHNFY